MSAPKILIVDDQPVNVQLLKRKLEREGMQVVSAYHGAEVAGLVAREKPDLILLDVMMPDMDGIEVCQRLQENEETRPIPVIFITARASKEGKLEGLGVGAVDYITKPIDLDETLARVQTQLSFLAINTRLHRSRCRLDDLLNGAVARFRHEAKITVPILVDNPLGDLVIETHVELFEDALGKILLNAWEAHGDQAPNQRHVALRAELVNQPETGRCLSLAVEDDGHGIAAEVRDQMFEPFISTKRTVGVGMGLTVARHALRNLGGDVTLHDRPGGGTTAVLLHPLEKKRTQGNDSRSPFA